jgi:peptidoglycan hydrolase CwlO-like protein
VKFIPSEYRFVAHDSSSTKLSFLTLSNMEVESAEDIQALDSDQRKVFEEQASKIVFLEWRSNSEERAHRQKASDMAWKIASLENEIEMINKDRTSLRVDIMKLESSLHSAEEELKNTNRIRQDNERYKSELQKGQKTIQDMNTQLLVLRAENTQNLRSRASEQQILKQSLRQLAQDCHLVSDDITSCMSSLRSCHRESIAATHELSKSIRACIVEAMEVSKETSALISDFDARSDNSCESQRAQRKSGAVLDSPMHDSNQCERKLMAVKEAAKQIVEGCAAAQQAVGDEILRGSDLCKWIRALEVMGDECDRCAADIREIEVNLTTFESEHTEVLSEQRTLTSLVQNYLLVEPVQNHLSRLPASLEKLKQTVRYICGNQGAEAYTRSDECLSELSTVSAVHDTSRTTMFTTCPSFCNTQFLQGLRGPRSGMGVTACGERLLFAGGTDGRAVCGDIEYFDMSTCTWGVTASMPSPRICCQLVSVREKLYVLGGEDADGRVLSSCAEFDLRVGKWSDRAPMRSARTGFGAHLVASDGVIVVAGGEPIALRCVATQR